MDLLMVVLPEAMALPLEGEIQAEPVQAVVMLAAGMLPIIILISVI